MLKICLLHPHVGCRRVFENIEIPKKIINKSRSLLFLLSSVYTIQDYIYIQSQRLLHNIFHEYLRLKFKTIDFSPDFLWMFTYKYETKTPFVSRKNPRPICYCCMLISIRTPLYLVFSSIKRIIGSNEYKIINFSFKAS